MGPSAVTPSPSRSRFRRWRKDADSSESGHEETRKNSEHRSSDTNKSNDAIHEIDDEERDCDPCNISDCLDSNSPGRPKNSSVLSDFLLLSLWEPHKNGEQTIKRSRRGSYCARPRARDLADTGDEASDYEPTDVDLNRDIPRSVHSNSTMDATDDGEVTEESEFPASPPMSPIPLPPGLRSGSKDVEDVRPSRHRLHGVAATTPPELRALKQDASPALSPIPSSKLLSYAKFYQESAASFQSWGQPGTSPDCDSEFSLESSDRSHLLLSHQVPIVRSTSQRSDSTHQEPQPVAAPAISRRLFKTDQPTAPHQSAAQFPGNLLFADNGVVSATVESTDKEAKDSNPVTDSLLSAETVLEEKKAVKILTSNVRSHVEGLEKVIEEDAVVTEAGSTEESVVSKQSKNNQHHECLVFPTRNLRRMPKVSSNPNAEAPKVPKDSTHSDDGKSVPIVRDAPAPKYQKPLSIPLTSSGASKAIKSAESSNTSTVTASESYEKNSVVETRTLTETTKKQQRRLSRRRKTDANTGLTPGTGSAISTVTNGLPPDGGTLHQPIASEKQTKTKTNPREAQGSVLIDPTMKRSARSTTSSTIKAQHVTKEGKETRSGRNVTKGLTQTLEETALSSCARPGLLLGVSASASGNLELSTDNTKHTELASSSDRTGRETKRSSTAANRRSRSSHSASRSSISIPGNLKTTSSKGKEAQYASDAGGKSVEKSAQSAPTTSGSNPFAPKISSSSLNRASRTRSKSKNRDSVRDSTSSATVPSNALSRKASRSREAKEAPNSQRSSEKVSGSLAPSDKTRMGTEAGVPSLQRAMEIRRSRSKSREIQRQSFPAVGASATKSHSINSSDPSSKSPDAPAKRSEPPIATPSTATTKSKKSRKILSFVPDVVAPTKTASVMPSTTASDNSSPATAKPLVKTRVKKVQAIVEADAMTTASISTATTATTATTTNSDPATPENKIDESSRSRTRRRFAARAASGGRHEVSKLAAAVVSARRQGQRDMGQSEKDAVGSAPTLSMNSSSTDDGDSRNDAPTVSSPTSATRSAISLLQEKKGRPGRHRRYRFRMDATDDKSISDKSKSNDDCSHESKDSDVKKKTEKPSEKVGITGTIRRSSLQRVLHANKNTGVVLSTQSSEGGEDKEERKEETSVNSGVLTTTASTDCLGRSTRPRTRRRTLHDLAVSNDSSSDPGPQLPGKIVIFQKGGVSQVEI